MTEVVGGTPAPRDDADDLGWFQPDELDGLPLTDDPVGHLRRAGVLPP